MANIKSAIKRVDVTAKKNLQNRMVKSGVKTAVKKFEVALQGDDKTAAEAAYVNAVSTLDKAAAKGVIHKNSASRRQARMAVKLAAK